MCNPRKYPYSLHRRKSNFLVGAFSKTQKFRLSTLIGISEGWGVLEKNLFLRGGMDYFLELHKKNPITINKIRYRTMHKLKHQELKKR